MSSMADVCTNSASCIHVSREGGDTLAVFIPAEPIERSVPERKARRRP
jgi:hypothetical protein